MPLDYPLWLRATHFFNFLFLSLLVRSGLEVLSAHPRLYWNDHCTPGSEWLKFTKKRRPTDRLDGQRRGNFVPTLDCAAGSRKPGSWTALAFSRRFCVAADRFGLCRDAVCRARVAAAASDVLADCVGRLAYDAPAT